MKTNKKMFGTSGVRGIVNEEINAIDFLKLGSAFGDFLESGPVLIGQDIRISSTAFKNAFIAGLLSSGIDVIDVGIVPTPAVLFAVKKLRAKGAAVITGSHTIKEVNGLVLFKGNTAELDDEDILKIERKVKEEYKPKTQWNQFGNVEKIEILDIYKNAIYKLADEIEIKINIVIDPGNGSMSKIMGDVLEHLGIKVIRINDTPDGKFPNRDPYPRKDNLNQLATIVKRLDNAIGVATDGDGDRCIFVAENGSVLSGDVVGAIFSDYILTKSRNKIIVCPINTSNLIEFIAKKHNGKVEYTKVGPPNIIKRLIEVNATFGFEETGKYIWPDIILYGDAIVSTLKLLKIIITKKATLKEIAESYPEYYQIKQAVDCPTKIKEIVTQKIINYWTKYTNEPIHLNLLDGIKITFPKRNCWMLIRPSGTEPKYRCYVECKNENDAKELSKQGIELIKKCIKEISKNQKS